jgi:hypothetical protein
VQLVVVEVEVEAVLELVVRLEPIPKPLSNSPRI